MIKTVLVVGAVIIAIPLVMAAMRPDAFRVERTALIQAPPEKVHGMINDMHALNSWNPFVLKDPNIKGDYRGPAAGAGSEYHFEGNKEVGKGSMTIVDSTPGRISMKLDTLEPIEGHNLIDFTLVPKAGATEVTWAIHGPSPFITKLVGVFLNMDKMIGTEFDKGFSMLKTKVEK